MKEAISPLVEIGDKIRFVPAANYDHSAGFGEILRNAVTGTVVQIHEAHQWYRVAYPMPGCIGHECFKFEGGYHENDSDP